MAYLGPGMVIYIYLIPGIFSERYVHFIFNQQDFQKIFRSESMHPIRRGLDVIHYQRMVLRKEELRQAGG